MSLFVDIANIRGQRWDFFAVFFETVYWQGKADQGNFDVSR
jgi:hypothetical protein